jgi:hypothetical protein
MATVKLWTMNKTMNNLQQELAPSQSDYAVCSNVNTSTDMLQALVCLTPLIKYNEHNEQDHQTLQEQASSK